MLRTNPTSVNSGPLIKNLDKYCSSTEPMSDLSYNFSMNPSAQSGSYMQSKLETIHPNPSLYQDNDRMYQTKKKLKSHGKEYNMLEMDKENISQQENYPSEKSDSGIHEEKLNNMMPYRDPQYDLFASGLPVATNQDENQQYLYQALIQNLYNNALMEAEILTRYNELQELARLQNTNNDLMAGGFTNLFLLNLYEKQKQDYQDFQLLQEAQRRLETPLPMGTNIFSPHLLQSDISHERKSPEMIVISDDDETNANQTYNFQNVLEKRASLREAGVKQEDLVPYDSTLLEEREFEFSTAIGGVTPESDSALEDHPFKEGKISIGPAYQTSIPDFKLNHERKPHRMVKLMWRPDVLEEQKLEQGFRSMEDALGEKITNREKAVKLFVKCGMEIGTVKNEIAKNRTFYKNYFKSAPRVLRKRN